MRSASAATPATSSVGMGPSDPGGGRTPAARATWRALILSPKASSTAGGGPMKVTPASATRRAKAAFSLSRP